MAANLFLLMSRVVQSLESGVPGLRLIPHIFEPEWLCEDESGETPEFPSDSSSEEWVSPLGFTMIYQGHNHGSFRNQTSGSDRERLLSAVQALMSDVQDIISETTKEPFPLVIVEGRRQVAMPQAIIEGDFLYMWFGQQSAAALKLPAVHLL
jgi:hypothetical protein